MNLFNDNAISYLREILKRRQKQVSLDGFLVKVAQKEKESTDSSDSVSDNETRPTQYLINSITLCILNLNNKI
jgi:hypothetical protein